MEHGRRFGGLVETFTCERCGLDQASVGVKFCEKCSSGRPEYYESIIACLNCGCLPTNRVGNLGDTFCCMCGTRKREVSLDYECQEGSIWSTTKNLIDQTDRPPNGPSYVYYCPACGIGASVHDGDELGKPPESKSEKWLRERKKAIRDWYDYGPGEAWLTIGAACFVVGLVFLWGANLQPQQSDGKISNPGEAVGLCQAVVKDFLKDSGSATFSSAKASRESGGGWTSSGLVTARNSFGALEKSSYLCTMSETNVTSVSIR